MVAGGPSRWARLSEGRTSEQRLCLLLDELQQQRRQDRAWLQCRGTGPAVPHFLRYEGRVRNLGLDCRTVGEMVAGLLAARLPADATLDATVHRYTSNKYSSLPLQMEFSYNLLDGLERFKTLPQLGLVLEVLLLAVSGDTLGRLLHTTHRLQSDLSTALELTASKSRSRAAFLSDSQFLQESLTCSNPMENAIKNSLCTRLSSTGWRIKPRSGYSSCWRSPTRTPRMSSRTLSSAR